MTPTQARALLKSAGLTPSDLARTMILLGDTREPDVVRRGIHHVLAKRREIFVPPVWAALVRVLAVVGVAGVERALREWEDRRTLVAGAQQKENLAIRDLFRLR